MSSSTKESHVAPEASAPHSVLVGVAGWSYDDWHGTFYPERKGRGFSPLHFTAERFDVIEINSTFYRVPDARQCERWAEEVADLPRFQFTAKLFRELTHGKSWESESDVLCRAFREALEPLVDAGRLGCVLVQFPWYFADGAQSRERIARIAEALAPLPLAIELRHASFLETGSGGGLPFLASLGVGFVNIDLPRSQTSPPPTAITTSDIGYFRLHGRNRSKWFDRRATRDEKYDYRYSHDELASLVPLLEAIARNAQVTYVITNNHFRGQAPANALELAALLSARRPPSAPGTASPDAPGAAPETAGDAGRHGEMP